MNHQHRPPAVTTALIRRMLHSAERDEVLADFAMEHSWNEALNRIVKANARQGFGNFINGALVLRGAEVGPGKKVYQVRNTFKPIDANTVQQIWETSVDAVEWETQMTLTFTRK